MTRKQNILLAALLSAWVWLPLRSVAAGPDIALVKHQMVEAMLRTPSPSDTLLNDFIRLEPEHEVSDQSVVEMMQYYPFDTVSISRYLARQRPDGSWSDIDYNDQRRSGWQAREHASRLLELAKLYRSANTPFAGRPRVLRAYHQALQFWIKQRPRCRNWWYNQIGIPKPLGESSLLMERELTSDEKAGVLDILNTGIAMTGQNKVWLAGNVLIRGLLTENDSLVREARNAIAGEIVTGKDEGIQRDWSFHQHGSQQQFGNYGLAFVKSLSYYASVLSGTCYAFTDEQRHTLVQLMEQGYRWVVWHRMLDVGALDRQLFHNAQWHKGYSVAFAAQQLGRPQGFPLHANELVGHKHFYCSDYTLHRRPTWMASLKMSSLRVQGTELVNEDNRLGYYMGDGATYYYMRGDEYLNVFPLWNFRLIPGTTSFGFATGPMPTVHSQDATNKSYKVGALSDTPQVGQGGDVSFSAMELNRNGIRAKKMWIFTPRYVLCLGGDICADTTLSVTTTIDQRVACGPLFVWQEAQSSWQEQAHLSLATARRVRLYHDRTGYIVGSAPLQADLVHRTGRWSDNMGSYSNRFTADGDVVQIVLDHGAQPVGAQYLYAVLPDADMQQVAAFDLAREVHVVRNDSAAQIVELAAHSGRYYAAVYQSGTYRVGGQSAFIEKPGCYEITQGRRGPRVVGTPFRMSASE